MPDRAQAGLIAFLLLLTACTPRDFLLGAGGAAGTASMQERGLSGALTDYQLRLAINESWFHHSIQLYERASLMISKGRVVIIGRVPSQELKTLAEELAIKAGAVNPVNRLTIGPDRSLGTRLADESISLRLEGVYTFDRDVKALNYDVETNDGTVYVIGEAESTRERQRVMYLARYFPGVKSVEAFIDVTENTQ